MQNRADKIALTCMFKLLFCVGREITADEMLDLKSQGYMKFETSNNPRQSYQLSCNNLLKVLTSVFISACMCQYCSREYCSTIYSLLSRDVISVLSVQVVGKGK